MFYRMFILFILVATFVSAQSYDWPGFRGPNRDGISAETNWKHEALKNHKILWQEEVGDGYATVSIKDGYLYTVGNRKKVDTIYCLVAATGKLVWKYSYPCTPGQYEGSRATPLVQDGVVYSVSREGHVFCLEATTGKVKWQKDFSTGALKAELPEWGFAGSPYISKNKLLLNIGEHGVALNKTTGDIIWKSNLDKAAGYATAVTYERDGKEYVLIFGSQALYVVEAETGKKVWSYTWTTSYGVNASDPIIANNRMFISSGYGYGCAFFNLTTAIPQMIGSKTEIMRTHFGTCIFLDDYLYGIDGQVFGGAWLKCIDFKTGEVKWSQSMRFGSLMAVRDGRLIIISDQGELIIVQANPTAYQELSRATLIKLPRGKVFWNMPVLCNGLVYVRSNNGKLLCVDLRK